MSHVNGLTKLVTAGAIEISSLRDESQILQHYFSCRFVVNDLPKN